MADLTEFAKKELSKCVTDFIGCNNYKVLKVEDNYCELEGEVNESSLNPYGLVHGGYIFGLADTAAGIAAKTTGRNAVTINSSIDYLKAVKDVNLKAIARSLKNGKSISVYEVFIYDEKETLVAKASVSYFYV